MNATAVLTRDGLDELVRALVEAGYRVVGPRLRDDAIVLAEIQDGAALPSGWGVETAPGRYRLHRRADAAVFAHSAGAQSWKQFLHPPRRRLLTAHADGFIAATEEPVRYAFLGVRACDLAAIATLGTVLGGGAHPDGPFTRCRAELFIVAVSCTEPGGVCFCASAGTGPTPGPGYDLSLTERIDGAGHRFVVEVGTAQGERVLAGLVHRAATDAEVDDARAALDDATTRMGRTLPAGDLRGLLRDARESPIWESIAQRCLTCGNCTMACPTCFCTTTEDTTDLAGHAPERAQRWASCFEIDFSYLHGGSVRTSAASRYRQWITHKFSSWHDQFGGSGCVGCGRCIAWCPVGIDITEELGRLADPEDGL